MPPKRKQDTGRSSSPAAKSRKLNYEEEDPNSWTVVQLKEFLKKQGQNTSGYKADLVKKVNKIKGNTEESSDSSEELLAESSEEIEPVSTGGRKNLSRKAQLQKRKKYSDEESSEKEDKEEEEEVEKVVKKTTKNTKKKEVEEEDQSEEEKPKMEKNLWEKEDTAHYCIPKAANKSKKIASFDMDSTLIETKSGNTFATSEKDWQWWDTSVPTKLKELHDAGYSVVIFSNQGGLTAKKKIPLKQLTNKIDAMMVSANVPIITFLSSTSDEYRKPALGMFELFEKLVHKVDKSSSFYVGDAAGRPDGWKKGVKKDFSCGDRKFASNLDIKFYTPEEYFLKQDPVKFSWGSFDPRSTPSSGTITENMNNLVSDSQEMIVMVGMPASGKSTFCKNHLIPKGYVHINRDTLKTPAKCRAAAVAALDEGKSVVIDNTNPDKDSRKAWISLAKEYKVPIRCYVMATDEALVKHLNAFRAQTTGVKALSRVVYNVFKGKHVPPVTKEGFSEVKIINFIRQHENEAHKKAFEFWTEPSKS